MLKPTSNTHSNNSSLIQSNQAKQSNNSDISYSIQDSVDLDGIMDELSSGNSAEIECKFENNCAIDAFNEAKDYYNQQMKHRELIPQDIKGLTLNFCDNLIGQFGDGQGSESNERKSISTMVKTGFLDFHKPSPSLSTQKDVLTENKLKMDLKADQEHTQAKGNKRVLAINKKFEEKDLLNIHISCNDNENDSLIQSSDTKTKKRHNDNHHQQKDKEHSEQKKQKHALSDSGDLIDDSQRK